MMLQGRERKDRGGNESESCVGFLPICCCEAKVYFVALIADVLWYVNVLSH